MKIHLWTCNHYATVGNIRTWWPPCHALLRKYCTVSRLTVLPLIRPISFCIVNMSSSACVGCSPTPSPALMTGLREYLAAICTTANKHLALSHNVKHKYRRWFRQQTQSVSADRPNWLSQMYLNAWQVDVAEAVSSAAQTGHHSVQYLASKCAGSTSLTEMQQFAVDAVDDKKIFIVKKFKVFTNHSAVRSLLTVHKFVLYLWKEERKNMLDAKCWVAMC